MCTCILKEKPKTLSQRISQGQAKISDALLMFWQWLKEAELLFSFILDKRSLNLKVFQVPKPCLVGCEVGNVIFVSQIQEVASLGYQAHPSLLS